AGCALAAISTVSWKCRNACWRPIPARRHDSDRSKTMVAKPHGVQAPEAQSFGFASLKQGSGAGKKRPPRAIHTFRQTLSDLFRLQASSHKTTPAPAWLACSGGKPFVFIVYWRSFA